jgi:hypothetical protein
MARILKIDEIEPDFNGYLIEEPVIASRHQAGQFLITLLSDRGERTPPTLEVRNLVQGPTRPAAGTAAPSGFTQRAPP